MQCTFCHGKLNRQMFGCPCDDSIVACYGCRQYGCYRCKADFKLIQLQFCVGCKQHRQLNKMFGDKYNSYCYSCCLRAYKNTTGKKVILCNHIFQPQKYQVYSFLKNFCYICTNSLVNEKPQDLQSGLKQIFPIDKSICKKCSQKTEQKQNYPRISQEQYKFTRNHDYSPNYQNQRSRQLKQNNVVKQTELLKSTSQSRLHSQRLLQTPHRAQSFSDSQYEANLKHQNQPNESPEDKWKRVQNSQFIRCNVCDYLVLDQGIINNDMALCKYCVKKSQMEEKELHLKNSGKKNSGSEIPCSPDVFSYTGWKDIPDHNFYDPLFHGKRKGSEGEGKANTKRQFEYRDPYVKQERGRQPQIKTYLSGSSFVRKNQQSSRSKLATPPKQPQKTSSYVSPQFKRYDYEGMPKKTVSNKEQQLSSCKRCGVQIQPRFLIWEDSAKMLMCRCCFAQFIEDSKKSNQRSQQYETFQRTSNHSAQAKHIRQKQIQRAENRQKYEVSQSKTSPNSKISNSQKNDITQPIIKQQQKKSTLNKVKRTQSWDDSILVQPVEDHERRKRVKQMSQRQKINQEQQFKFQYSANSEQEEKQKIVKQGQSPKNNVQSRPKQVQPTITQEEQQNIRRSKIQNRKSWDENIILQPIDQSKKQNKLGQEPSTMNYEIKQPTNSPKRQTYSRDIISRKYYSQQQNQPIIVQQSKQTRSKVKKMQSWDQAIILQPEAEHLERKKQRSMQQNMPKTTSLTNIKQQNQGNHKQYKFEQRVRSKQKYENGKSKQKQTRHYEHIFTRNPSPYQNNYFKQNASYSTTSTNLNPNTNRYQHHQRVIRENQKKSADEFDDFQKKYRQMKRQIDENMKASFNKLLGQQTPASKNSTKRQSDPYSSYNTRQQHSKYYQAQQSRSRQKLRSFGSSSGANTGSTNIGATKSPLKQASPAQSRYYYSPYGAQKNDDKTSKYSQSTAGYSRARQPEPTQQLKYSRASEYYYPAYGYTFTETAKPEFSHGQYEEKVRGDRLTGHILLDQKQNRICRHCRNKFTTTYKDYYIMGHNVCLDCYGEYHRSRAF